MTSLKLMYRYKIIREYKYNKALLGKKEKPMIPEGLARSKVKFLMTSNFKVSQKFACAAACVSLGNNRRDVSSRLIT